MNDFLSVVLFTQTAMLAVGTVLIAYPVVAYARNVAHTRGLLLLSGSFLGLTATYVVSFVFQMNVVSGVLDLTSAVLTAAGAWEFARPFVDLDGQVETPTVDGASGGFETAGADGGVESGADDGGFESAEDD